MSSLNCFKGSNRMTLYRMIICSGLTLGLALGLAFGSASISRAAPAAPAQDLQNTIYLDTKDGRITILLRPDLAPKHVTQIEALTKRGFYNGLVFHRVIDGFMAQTGDPKGDGTGGSGHKLKAEFSDEKHVRGVVSM